MKLIYVLLVAGLVLQACGSSSGGGGGNGAGNGGGAGGNPPAQNPQQPPTDPSQPPQPTRPGEIFFAGVDQAVAKGATGDLFISERFYILMSRLSVYALLCDFKNEKGYSKEFSQLYNSSTALQALAEKTYGGQTPAYNRFEKQRNVESNRLSFQSGPNACAVSEPTFGAYMSMTPAQLENVIRTAAPGSL